MEPSQRQKTASELNAAILSSQRHETEPRVALVLKLMLWAQQRLDERVSYPKIADLVAAAPGGGAAPAGGSRTDLSHQRGGGVRAAERTDRGRGRVRHRAQAPANL